MSEEKFRHNFDKNRTWFWTSIELLAMSIYFIITRRYFEYPPPTRDYLTILDNQLVQVFVIGVAVFGLVWSLFDFHQLHAHRYLAWLMLFTLAAYTAAFILRDYDLNRISLGAIFTGILLARIIHETLRNPELIDVKRRLKHLKK